MLSHMPFTLRQLDIFSSLCATRSFRRTVELLGISQASVSNQVKALEHQLGFAVFDRLPGRRPRLTERGVAFETDFQRFRKEALALAAHRRPVAEGPEKPARFRIQVGQGLLDNYIRPRLGAFLAANPRIELVFDARLPTDQLYRDLEGGQYDFAMVHRRADRKGETFMQRLALVRGGIYGHRKYAEGKAWPLQVDDVNQLPFILLNATNGPERDMVTYLDDAGIRPQRVVGHAQYYDVMATMLHSGIGVASFSDPILPPSMREDVIMLYPMDDWILLWFRKDATGDPRCNAVQDFLWNSVLHNPEYLTTKILEPGELD